MSDQSFDLVVIGAGPGGYVAAIRGAQEGLKVAIVEKDPTLGGTCLNWGCIPSKALLDSSELYHQALHKFDVHGISISKPKVNFKQMMARKSEVVSQTTKGIEYLMDKNKITVLKGLGSFESATTLTVSSGKKSETIQFKRAIIATGSDIAELPSVPFDHKTIIDSTDALSLTSIPKSLTVIGGGVIGVEMGSIYARLGSKVTIVEFFDRLIPTMDKQCGKALERSFKQLNIDCHFKTKVTGFKTTKSGVTLTAEKAGKEVSFTSEKCLVAIGRRPFTQNLGLDKIGLSLDDKGRIPVNAQFQTAIPSVYAIGDVIAGPMLAHKASEEGVAAVEYMCGKAAHYNPLTIPGVVYTWPEVASVGQTEEQLKEQKVAYKAGSFPFKASGRARASEETEGFIKVLSDSTTDEILGIHMVGPRAADMISEAVVAMEYRASAQDIGMMMHPHPTYSEAFKEAALGATGNRAIHI